MVIHLTDPDTEPAFYVWFKAPILRLIWGFTIVLSGQTQGLAAEQEPIDTLDPIVVSATTIPTRLSHAPAAVTVIHRDQIAAQQANRLSSILQQIPGVFVDEMGGRGGISSVYIRGGDPNFTLIMIDGIPINDPSNQRGGSVNLTTLTPERIEKIEVVRGPVSVVYGSDAMAGAINIVTRKGQPNPSYFASGEGGQFGYGRGVLQTRGPFKDALYSGSFAFTRNDEQVESDRFQNLTTGGNLDWSQNSTMKIQMTGQYSHSEIRAFPEGSGGSRLAILRTPEGRLSDEFLIGVKLSHQLTQGWDQQVSANVFSREEHVHNPGVQQTLGLFRNPPDIFTTNFSRSRFQWTLHHRVTPTLSFSGGSQLIHENAERTGTQQLTVLGFPADIRTAYNKTRTTFAGYIETIWNPFSDATVTSSLRVDDPQGFSPEVSPRVAITLQLWSTTFVRGSYSEGFKLPSFYALSDPLIGNSSLVPETSQGWDLNVRHTVIPEILQLDLTYFSNRFSNLIDLDPGLAKQNIFNLVNLSTVVTNGLEVGVSATPLPWFQLKAFFTYLNTDIVGSNDPLRNRPKTSGGLIALIRPTSRLEIRSQVQAVGRRFDLQIPTSQTTVPGYYRMDLAATLRVKERWKIFMVSENLTNVRYEEFLGFEAPSMWVRFGIKWEI